MSKSERTARLRAAQQLPAEFMDEVDREELRELTDRAHYAHRLGVRKTDHGRGTRDTRIHASNK